MIIAFDGTSSSGKSSIARALGQELNISVLGTGSIYRAIALKMLNFGISEFDEERIKNMLETTLIQTEFVGGRTRIVLDGITQDLEELNSHEVSVFVPKIACKSYVREFVRNIQRQAAKSHDDIIVEGRDIGSVVFPNADLKIFIDADQTTRAKRRLADYKRQGKDYSLSQVIQELEERDNEDRNRELSPLIMTSDSVIIDTTDLSIDQCVNRIVKLMNEKAL